MKHKLLAGIAVSAMLAATPALAGNIFLTGHDNDFHQSTAAKAQMAGALNFVRFPSLPSTPAPSSPTF